MFKVARGGANWVLGPIVLAILCVGMATPLGRPELVPLSAGFLFLFMFMLMFFRDPERRVGDDIVSAADGKVVRIDQVDDPDLGPCDRMAVFMSPLDVHVNRLPMAGSIRSVVHHPGKHVPAFNKDSDRNERMETILRTELGDIKVIQIAGSLARRIQPYLEKGTGGEKGQRMGIIKLGSRCDILIPVGKARWTVRLKQRVFAGATRVAEAL